MLNKHNTQTLPTMFALMMSDVYNNPGTSYFLLLPLTGSRKNRVLGYSRTAHAGSVILAHVYHTKPTGTGTFHNNGSVYGQIAWDLIGIKRLSEEAREFLHKADVKAGDMDSLFCCDA